MSRTLNSPNQVAKKNGNISQLSLLDNDTIKIKSLLSPLELESHHTYLSYYNCANFTQDSLTELYLTKGMLGRRDFCQLSGFKQLEELIVDENVSIDFYDYETLLKHLSHLAKLHVDCFQRGNNMDVANIRRNNISTTTVDYSKLKHLALDSYFPHRDEELLFIEQKYTGLEHLEMTGLFEASWPLNTISKEGMMWFIQFMSKIEYCSIAIGGKSGENWFMNVFSNTCSRINREDSAQISLKIGNIERNLAHLFWGRICNIAQCKQHSSC
jgi:hypothetical protein